MNADDPILLERRCDARVPTLGAVCVLPADHDGDHVADVDPVALGRRLTLLEDANRALVDIAQLEHDSLLRSLRSSRLLRVTTVVLGLMLVMNIGLRLMGV